MTVEIAGAGTITRGTQTLCDNTTTRDSDQVAITCGAVVVGPNDVVDLTAGPAPSGWRFLGWDRCASVKDTHCMVKGTFQGVQKPIAFYEDVQAPDLTMPKLPGLIGIGGVRPTLSSSDPTASFACQLDNQPFAPCVSGQQLAALDGPHTLRVKAVDPSGHESAVQPFDFMLDTIAPRVRLTASPAARVNSRVGVIEFRDEVGGRTSSTCALDGGTPAPCAGTFKVVNLADGPHHVEIRTSDGVNVSEPVTVDWTVDTTAPVLTFEPSPEVTPDTNATVLWTTDDAATATCSLDGAAAAPCNNGWFVAHDLAQGAHTLRVTVSDGLNARTYTRSWMVVTLPPAVSTGG